MDFVCDSRDTLASCITALFLLNKDCMAIQRPLICMLYSRVLFDVYTVQYVFGLSSFSLKAVAFLMMR